MHDCLAVSTARGTSAPSDTRCVCRLAGNQFARGGRTIRRMSGEPTTWYELLPDGHAEDGAERYGERSAAEQAATAMLIRRPELVCVDVAECSENSAPSTVGRISGAQPPAPQEAEVDGLHRLPRGAPEC
jgi:hypothetical protein